MSSTNTSSTRTCPVCDAPNSNLSLFCAECGASLNTPAEGDTAALDAARPGDDTQQTATFVPSPGRDADRTGSHATPASSPNDRATYTPTWEPTRIEPAKDDPVWTPLDDTVAPVAMPTSPPSMRGFFLGLFAFLLILAVFMLWTWAAILSQDTRNSIQDIFGFIG
jgi:hypothetical protein